MKINGDAGEIRTIIIVGLICWMPLCALCTPVGGTLLTIFIFGVAGIISYSKHKERTGGNNGISQSLHDQYMEKLHESNRKHWEFYDKLTDEEKAERQKEFDDECLIAARKREWGKAFAQEWIDDMPTELKKKAMAIYVKRQAFIKEEREYGRDAHDYEMEDYLNIRKEDRGCLSPAGAEYLYDMKLKIDKAFSEYKGVKDEEGKWKKYAIGEAMPNEYERIFHNYTKIPSVNVPTDKLRQFYKYTPDGKLTKKYMEFSEPQVWWGHYDTTVSHCLVSMPI